MNILKIITFIMLFLSMEINAQEKILLYPKGAKDSNELKTEKANGTALLICPGGGYAGVSVIKEGEEIAKWFNQLGVSAFVLYYRMPNGHYKIPLEDEQKAFSIIRKNAKKWKINKKRIGVMGFSAGGHLAATAGTHFKNKCQRPTFLILGYPVITMDSTYTHMGSRRNLLGKNPDEKLVKQYSNELHVTKKTPPTFLFCAKDDKAVPVANSENFANALRERNIPVELLVYEKGGHGFGMRPKGVDSDNWAKESKKGLIEQRLIEDGW